MEIRTSLRSTQVPTERSQRPHFILAYMSLPLLGKAMERLLKKCILPYFTHTRSSVYEYGFRRGKSSEGALCRVRHIVRTSDSRHVTDILFDATAAFDNLWWPAIFNKLAERGCPVDLARLLAQYLHNRQVTLQGKVSSSTKTVTKGLPPRLHLRPRSVEYVL